MNRVNYLQKEEQKVLKKILRARDDVEKQQKMKTEKINNLQERIGVE